MEDLEEDVLDRKAPCADEDGRRHLHIWCRRGLRFGARKVWCWRWVFGNKISSSLQNNAREIGPMACAGQVKG